MISGSPRPYMRASSNTRGDAAAPPLNDMHVLKCRADGDVTDAGMAFNQMVDGQIGAQPAWGCDFQTVIIDCHLDGSGRQIRSMTYGVRDSSLILIQLL